jgi:serine/threonine protein phosphatase PrpC
VILNKTVREINFHVRGISSERSVEKTQKKKKRKIFKGKKIKCIHDLSKTGLSGDDKKVNQDNYFIFKNFAQGFDNIFMGVCDGHGFFGHEVSGFIKENLPMDLNHLIKKQNLNILKDDLSSTIKQIFLSENRALLRNKQIDSDLSGSTCISVIYTPEKLIIANIGDSRAVLGKYVERENDNDKKRNDKFKWVAKNLSRDHKPIIPEEAERIIKKGGRIRPMRDEDGEYIGPLRVYLKNKNMPGLAMTRSFGDVFGAKAGIISEPEVTEYFFKEEDKFLILASDGLFEFMGSQEIIDIVKNYYAKNDIVGCCEYLYKESTRKWLKEEEDVVDDITIILVFFEDYYIEID